VKAFIMHVGHGNKIDIDYTIKRRRAISEILEHLPHEAVEREFFETNTALHRAFPDGTFHCWGVPPKAFPSFTETEIGDLVLFAPWIGIHDGGIYHIGVVKAICPVEAWYATKILWPETPQHRPFPLLFFFEAEAGYRDWYDFLSDLGIGERWNPRGWYKQLASDRFQKFGGVEGYLHFLRQESGFCRIDR
jgi:hypothetical protein